MKRRNRLGTLAALLALGLLPASALGQSSTSVGVVTTLTGQATVARVSLPQPLPLRFKDDVYVRDRISTAEKSIVRVLLGGKALVTARELSVLTITEEMGRSTVELGSGKIAVGVARQRMRPGEIVEIRTPNVVAAVRGTVLVVEIIRASADAQGGATPPTTNVHVIHGLVDVFSTGTPGAPPVQVATLQTYSQIGGAAGTLRNLSREAAESLFADLRSDPQFSQGPGEFMHGMQERELDRATALAHAILPESGHGGGGSNGEGPAGDATDRDDPRLSDNRNACSQGGCGPSGGQGGGTAKSGKALATYNGQVVNLAGNFYSVPNGSNIALNQPLLETTASTLTVGGSLVDVKGSLTASDPTNPFISLDPTTLTAGSLLTLSAAGSLSSATTFFKDLGGSITLTGDAIGVTGNSTVTGTGAASFLVSDGSTMAVSGNVLNETGAGSSVTLKGSLLEQSNGATVTAQKLVGVNAALLDASAPLLSLTGKSLFTSAVDAVDLASVNKATQFAALAKLDASTFTVKVGAALNLTGGSVVAVLGDLFTLANQSTLKILSGPLISLNGNSSLNITGSILNFLGTGNTVTVTNSLCAGACPIVMGVPVFVTGGATVSLTNPVKNLAGNTITYSSASAALISISGASSQITVQGK
ncbi:MAG TPA: FecR domain-containing protein [Methylomirabilota bacterium]|nr:FecR domain-containing protein [Methylomirabilota bacterium]